VIVVSFVASLALAGLALVPARRWRRPVLWTAAGLSMLYVLALSLAVFAEDAYTQSGSNWSNRTSHAHVIYLAVAGIGTAVAVAFGLAAATKRTARPGRSLFVAAGAAELFMAWVVALAFLSN
jgi:ABC-type Fe3+ transport system permease subunit